MLATWLGALDQVVRVRVTNTVIVTVMVTVAVTVKVTSKVEESVRHPWLGFRCGLELKLRRLRLSRKGR